MKNAALACLVVLAVLSIGDPVHAKVPSVRTHPNPAAAPTGMPTPARLDGDTFETAFVVPGLPFEATGSTVGYTANYAEMCPSDIWAPDVVYAVTPAVRTYAEISLCNPGTDYDTGLLVYRNNLAGFCACNDDACATPDMPDPYVSRIPLLRLDPGNTYYIVISGYAPYAGNYHLTINPIPDPFLVHADASGFFPDIQSAIDAAVPGDTVRLAPGIFRGPGNRALSYNGKALVVRSEEGNPATCVIDCENAGRAFVFDEYEPPEATLDGVTLANGLANDGSFAGGAIEINFASPTIRRCIFRGNHAQRGGAVASSFTPAPPRIEDCLFADNVASVSGGAFYGENSGGAFPFPAFLRCTFVGNRAVEAGGAVHLWHGDSEFRDCTMVKNTVTGAAGFGGAVASQVSGVVRLERSIIAANLAATTGGVSAVGLSASCCDVFANVHGDWGGVPNPTGSDGNISLDPRFCDYDSRDFHLAADSPCAPFTPPNPECDLIGAWPVGCAATSVEAADGLAAPQMSVLPNPTTGSCRIVLSGAANGGPGRSAVVTILDACGRLVRRLNPTATGDGRWSCTWDGRDDEGREAPRGVYFARGQWSGGDEARRLIRLR